MFVDPRKAAPWDRGFGARSVIPRKVLDGLLRHGPCTRAQLSRMIGVPNGSVTKAVNVLLDCGLVETGESVSYTHLTLPTT